MTPSISNGGQGSPGTMERPALDLERLMDEQRTTIVQVRVGAICAAVNFCDAFSIQAVNYAGPSIRDNLGLGVAQMGTIFSISLLGMMLGSFAVGPISDRWGRRPPLLVLTALFGVLTMLTALATQFWHVAALRLLDGIALGAALPNAYVLAAEYSPRRNRRFTVALMMVGYTAGGLTAGLVAGPLIEAHSWRLIFIVGGAAAMATLLLAWLFVPESMHILAKRPDRRAALQRIVARVAPQHLNDLDRLVVKPPSRVGASVRELFSSRYWKATIGLWTVAFCVMLDVYMFTSWTPILLRDEGIPLQNAILITAMYNLGTVGSAVLAGWLMDRLHPLPVLVGLLAFGGAAIGSMGLLLRHEEAMAFASLAIGVGLGGALGAMNLLATTIYPPSARVTGTGWAISVGRLGSVIGPALAAAWLTAGLRGGDIYFAALVPAAVAAAVTILLLRKDPTTPAVSSPP